jgi:hypothetical protein
MNHRDVQVLALLLSGIVTFAVSLGVCLRARKDAQQ